MIDRPAEPGSYNATHGRAARRAQLRCVIDRPAEPGSYKGMRSAIHRPAEPGSYNADRCRCCYPALHPVAG